MTGCATELLAAAVLDGCVVETVAGSRGETLECRIFLFGLCGVRFEYFSPTCRLGNPDGQKEGQNCECVSHWQTPQW
jgi:hypothetical protein